MSQPMNMELQEAAAKLTDMAMDAGAIDADALAVCDCGDSVHIRHGKVEGIEREDSQGLGLRAFVATANGPAFATASSSDLSEAGLKRLVQQVMDMARISEADPDAVMPQGAEHPTREEQEAWQLRHDSSETGWDILAARDAAMACEEAALRSSDKISNSEGASAAFGSTAVAYADANGFAGFYQRASCSLSLSVVAGTGDGMQRDYAWHRARHIQQLRSADAIGREAAERAERRLGASSMANRQCTVVYEPRLAAGLLGHLIGAINGKAVLQKRSFLADALGEQIFPDTVQIMDHPDHPEGMGNRLFDGEGSRCAPLQLIDGGRLNSFLHNRYSAKRMGTRSTGHARRGLTGDIGIGTSNLIWEPGEISREDMLHEIGDGLLVTELIGFGINGVTGDYSRGAVGFLIENGKLTRPVQEITIAGNLKEMFANIAHVGNDLTWLGSTAVPSIAIAGMTVAGQGD